MTSSLDKLLTQQSTRSRTLEILQTLETGGGVITSQVKDPEERVLIEAALKEFGAVKSPLGFWKNPTVTASKRAKYDQQNEIDQTQSLPASISESSAPLLTFGAALPPRLAEPKQSEEEPDSDDEGPLPATAANRRLPHSSATQEDTKASSRTNARGEWMMQELKATDPTEALRQKAITSQAGRTFNNVKSSGEAAGLGTADSRSVATGKTESTSGRANSSVTNQQDQGFRWNHEEMMAVEKIDKSRLSKILSESISSKFAPAGSNKRFL